MTVEDRLKEYVVGASLGVLQFVYGVTGAADVTPIARRWFNLAVVKVNTLKAKLLFKIEMVVYGNLALVVLWE